jgi:plastocyanin
MLPAGPSAAPAVAVTPPTAERAATAAQGTAVPGLPATPSAVGGAVQAAMVDNRFEPSHLTVTVGTTVTWTNHGNNAHTVTALDGSWDSGTLLSGDQFRHTFTAPGTYRFFCRQHVFQGMGGTVVVVEGQPPGASP